MAGKRTVCIILNYNDAPTTLALVRELRESRELDALVVVDNCSSDHSWEQLCGLADGERIHVLRTERNGGYGTGNQAGIDYACRQLSPDYLVIANPDIHVEDSCIRRVRQVLARQRQAGAASAVVRLPGGEESFSYWDLQPLWKELLDTGLITRRVFRGLLRTPREALPRGTDPAARLVGALPGSFFMLEVERLRATGGLEALFDPEVFLYCEEKILARKLADRGLCEVLASDVSYVHAHAVSISKSLGQIAERQAVLHRSKRYYYKRYLGCGPVRMALARGYLAAVLAEVWFLTRVLRLRW